MGLFNALLRNISLVAISLSLVITSGCANLETVRNFSKESANLTAGPEAINYWAAWNKRSERFQDVIARLKPPIKGPTKPISPPDKVQIEEIKSLQITLAAYLTKLGALADDDSVDVSNQVQTLVTNLNKLPTDSADERSKVNEAYGAILKLVKLPLDSYRHYKIKQLINENNKNILVLTNGLSKAMESVSKFVRAEKASVTSWLALNTPLETRNFTEAYTLTKEKESIEKEYDEKIKAIDAYKNALTTIGKMHGEMDKKLSSFDTEDFKVLVKSLQQARIEIKSAQDKYEKAFD